MSIFMKAKNQFLFRNDSRTRVSSLISKTKIILFSTELRKQNVCATEKKGVTSFDGDQSSCQIKVIYGWSWQEKRKAERKENAGEIDCHLSTLNEQPSTGYQKLWMS